MEKTVQLYEGKAKKVYATNDENYCIVSIRTTPPLLTAEEGHDHRQGRHQQQMTNRLMQKLERRRAYAFRGGAL